MPPMIHEAARGYPNERTGEKAKIRSSLRRKLTHPEHAIQIVGEPGHGIVESLYSRRLRDPATGGRNVERRINGCGLECGVLGLVERRRGGSGKLRLR